MTFPDLLAAIGLAPKTLPQAKETLDTAKATLDSVAALFTAAGLNLEQLLAAGPESLKAHLASIENTKELAEALEEKKKLASKLEAETALLNGAVDKIEAYAQAFQAIGISSDASASDGKAIKSAFEAHVQKQTTLALAKTGHPPAHVPAVETAPASKTDADIAKEYQAMRPGPERLAFYTQHEAALERFAKSLRRQD